jgi:hypothetical protein
VLSKQVANKSTFLSFLEWETCNKKKREKQSPCRGAVVAFVMGQGINRPSGHSSPINGEKVPWHVNDHGPRPEEVLSVLKLFYDGFDPTKPLWQGLC